MMDSHPSTPLPSVLKSTVFKSIVHRPSSTVYRLSSIVLFLLSSLQPALPQMKISVDPPGVAEVFEAMYRYDFPDADRKLRELNLSSTDPDWIDLAHANLLWWKLISGDETQDYDNLMAAILNRVIRRVDTQPPECMTDEQVFTLIHSYAYLTRVDIYREHYLRGLSNLTHTLDYLDIALKNADRYDKFLMVSGLYNFFAAAATAEYPVFIPFFILAPHYDRNTGFNQLSRCAAMDNLLIRNESLYYLMKIFYQLEKKYDEALRIADSLLASYPNNLMYHFHRFMILIEAGRKNDALAQYNRMKEVADAVPGLNSVQRGHFLEIAVQRLKKEKINPAI